MKDRVAYIDNLRIMVNFLIVLNHSLWNRSLETFFSHSELELVELLRFISMNLSPIRVPFFFLIAGLFSAITLRKWGATLFVRARFKRILVPLAFALFTYVYLVLVISRFSQLSLLWDWETYTTYVLSGFSGLGYVWFLYVLIIYSLLILAAYWMAQQIGSLKVTLRLVSGLICRNRYGFLGALLALEFMKFVFIHTVPEAYHRDLPFFPLSLLISNITYFVTGVLAGLSFRDFHDNIRFNLCEFTLLVLVYASMGISGYVMGNHYGFQLYSVVSNALPLALFISLFNVFLNKRVRQLNFVTNSTYTIYLIHFPVICLLSYGLVHSGIPALTVYFTVIILAYPLSLGASLLIRRIKPIAFLFGAKPLYSFRRKTS